MSNSTDPARRDGQAAKPPGELPPASSSNIYELLGGAAAVRGLADRFYALMDELPEAARVRRLHPDELTGCADRLFEYLSGWLGGPALCTARQAPHHPCAIGSAECNEWLLCMRLALAEQVQDAELRAALLQALRGMAEALIRESTVPSTHQEPQP
jgi:hemoglobin